MTKNINKELFEKIKSLYKLKHKAVPDIAAILGLSKSGVYSKINGRTNFTVEELSLLCRHFKLSLDYFVYQDNLHELPYAFLADTIRSGNDPPEEYVTNLFNHISLIDKIENLKVSYLANDIPLFHYMSSPKLLCLRLYLWEKMKAEVDYKFEDILANQKIIAFSNYMSNTYSKYSTTEIWHPNMFLNVLHQVIYFAEDLKRESTKLLPAIKVELLSLIDLLDKGILKESNKNVYLNELYFGNEMILIKGNDQSILYKKYDSPNFIRSLDTRICEHADTFINNIISHSTSISKGSKRKRAELIKKYRHDINTYFSLV